MANLYLGYNFTVTPTIPGVEILIAQLGETAFESFVETEKGVTAYVQKDLWNENILSNIQLLDSDEFSVKYTVEEIEQVNWNEEWEKNFEPILVDETCYVHAPFHDRKNVEYNIEIEPKMSFGTGHHETTHMMIQHLLDTDVFDKSVLDMGCGTAILAILAEMKGAQPIDAIDIDNWCYLNSIENAERNNCKHISVFEGDAALLKGKNYDIIIANINRNILLEDMQQYTDCLNPKGILLLSGFYDDDIPAIDVSCQQKGLSLIKKYERNKWVALKYVN